MKSVEQIEASLERMLPAAPSRRASRQLDEMIDGLAIQAAEKQPGRWRALRGWSAVAAAFAIGVFSTWEWGPWRTAAPQPDARGGADDRTPRGDGAHPGDQFLTMTRRGRCFWIALALTCGVAFADAPDESGTPAPGANPAPVPAPESGLPPGLVGPNPEPGAAHPAEEKPVSPSAERRHRHPFGRNRCVRDNASWLGVSIERPSPELRAQLPGLASGIGFVIKKVNSGGPAENAGLQPNDVIWKINDQLLANEAQLWVLLGLWKPGETVRIDYLRGGQAADTELTLGKSHGRGGFDLARNDGPFFIGPPGTGLHIVDVPRREASVENDDGQAVLTVDQTGFRVKISDPQGKTIHEGPLFDANGKINVPKAWRERIESLHSTLAESLKRVRGARPPRMRVIPKAKADP